MSGCVYSFVVTKNYCDVELALSSSNKDFNKKVFDYFYDKKDNIENEFGDKLFWERLDDKKMSRISYRLEEVSIFDKDDWNKMITFLTENMIKLDKVLKKYINSYSRKK